MTTMAATPRLLRSTPPPTTRTYLERVAALVRAELGRSRVSTAEFAEILNVSVGRANHLKTGRRSFDLDEMRSLCEALDLDMIPFLERAAQPDGRPDKPPRVEDVRTLPCLRGTREWSAGDTIEARSYNHQPYRVYVTPNESGYTVREVRLLISDLKEMANGLENTNRRLRKPVSIDGRELLLLPSTYAPIFADGKPKRVISETSSAFPDAAPHLRAIPNSWEHIGPGGLTKPHGVGKRRLFTFYRLLGLYELVITGNRDEEMLLVAKVTDR